jgi:hypothetical protein
MWNRCAVPKLREKMKYPLRYESRTGAPSANWGQIIHCYWFYPPIIGNYWILLAIIIFLQKVLQLLAIIAPCPNINYCDYCIPIIAINLFCLKLFALFAIIVIIMIIGINLN